MSTDPLLKPGDRVGSFELIERLGSGGMGDVFRARDTRLGRTVALKFLKPGASDDLLRRLDREARAVSALNHPNIVQIYDVPEWAEHPGQRYIVMEDVAGETLRRRLSRGPLSVHELLQLGAQLTDGLAKAHRAGILHRDLKPENLMVTPEGTLKILDFGLAKLATAPLADIEEGNTVSRHETRVGTLLGTLEYMSPEQASGKTVDHRSDQFSSGLVLWEMAAGRPTFGRDTPAQVLAAVIEREAPPLRELRPEVPADLETLVVRCLQKDPARRFATTDELATEVAVLAGRSRSGSLSGPLAPQPSAASLPPRPLPLPPLPLATGPAVYHVQSDDDVRVYDEAKLVKALRRGKLSGLEMVRREGEEQWQPLFESRIYRLEVPSSGDPRDAARRRLLRGFGAHFTGFFTTAMIMTAIQHQIPFWIWIWGAVLAAQALRAAPAAWVLYERSRKPLGPGAAVPALPGDARRALPVASVLAQEADRVRALIAQRGGKDTQPLLDEVEGIVKRTEALVTRMADLEEQTSPGERAALARAVAEARERLERADSNQDRRLFERQLEVLLGREEAITKAVRVLERLRVRRDLAEHQLKQLRLDLSRGAAGDLALPELSSRLEFIRDEIDAREEVEEIAKGGK